MRTSEEKTLSRIVFPALIVATAISIYLRLFYGWDQDESYVTLLAYRISEGDRLLYDLMDLHQTGALIPVIFCKIYVKLVGGTEGIGLFLRFISAVVQILLSIFVFAVIKKIVNPLSAFFASVVVANLLPRATQQLEYGSITIWAAIVADLLLLDWYYDEEKHTYKIIVAALAYSISVLAYPTMLITVPVYFVFLFKYSNGKPLKTVLLFFSTCALLALMFFAYVVSFSSFSDLLFVLKTISNTGDHDSIFAFLLRDGYVVKPAVRIIATVSIAFLISFLLNKVYGIEIKSFYYYILMTTLVVVFLNLTGLRPSGPYGFLERYIGMVILAIPILKSMDYKPITLLFFFGGVLYFIGSLMGSNLGPNENAMFLELAIIVSVLLASVNSKKFERVAVIVFLLGVIFSAGYFVRVRYTEPANFTQCTMKFENGPLKGIYVREDQYEEMSNKADFINKFSEVDKTYAVLTNDPIYNYYIKGRISAAGFTTTSVRNYNDLWINYYTQLEHELPDVFFADTYWFSDIEDFYATDFGDWLRNYYTCSPEKGEFWVLKRNK